MTGSSISPISDSQAKAIEATAKATEKAADVLSGLGGYLKEVFGTVPHDLVGYFGGDLLKIRRAENLRDILERSKERLEARGVHETAPPSLSISLPIMVAAADESRDELRDIWAGLLATAADPASAIRFRNIFIDIAKKLDPLDASVLNQVLVLKHPLGAGSIFDSQKYDISLRDTVGATADEISVSLQNLRNLSLVNVQQMLSPPTITALGREFLRAVLDEWPDKLKR